MNLMKELNLTPMKKSIGRNPIVERREVRREVEVCGARHFSPISETHG